MLQYQIIRNKLKCMRRAQDRARSATFKTSGAQSATIELRTFFIKIHFRFKKKFFRSTKDLIGRIQYCIS